ncbi:RICIN domain-containing protein [Kitasatospora sp. NPDC059327]|uniref:RICIN domain-containing protein n=1 Tax=Kitasatospora sp. NPDC059327 TaxID=3346803 RepID=UPI0036BFD79D
MSLSRPRAAWLTALFTVTATGGLLSAPTQAGAVVGDAAPNGSYAFTAKIDIGNGQRACTGALVDRFWVLTAASCFAADPAQPSTVPAGRPALATTVTVGRTDLTTTAGQVRDVVELVPRPDRDLVLARLVNPVTDIAPLTVSTTAPALGEELQVPGYGRTATDWLPDQLHSAAFTVGAVTPTGLDLTPKAGTPAALCKGDTGSPAVRTVNGKAELAGVTSLSWQNGCFGSAETAHSGAVDVRVDDLGGWIQQVRATDWKTPLVNTNSGKCLEIENSQLVNGARAQQWTCYDMPTSRWIFHWAGDGWEVVNSNSGKALEIADSLKTDGAPAQQWSYAGIATQKWDLVKGTNGYALKNRNSGKALEIDNSLKTDGALAQQWTYYGIPTQQWAFSY